MLEQENRKKRGKEKREKRYLMQERSIRRNMEVGEYEICS